MIDFMLKNARIPARGLDFALFSKFVEAFDANGVSARNDG